MHRHTHNPPYPWASLLPHPLFGQQKEIALNTLVCWRYMYKVLRPVDTNDATRGFWPRYQEPGPPTFLQGVRTLLGTNLQSLNAEKEAGGHSSFHQSVANEATDDRRGYEPGTPGSRTCFSFSTVDKLSTLVFWFHGPSRYFPLNLFFPSKGAA